MGGDGRSGVDEKIFTMIWQGIKAHGWKGSRAVWTVGKVGIVKYAWVSAPINERCGKGREVRKFWNDVNACMMKIGRGSRIVLIGDMNGRVGSNEIPGVVI